MFTPLQFKRFSDGIVEQIVDLIKDGKLNPGDILPSEREMANQLSVSRPPLREALKTLETMGFIEVQHRRRSVVKSLADSSLRDPLARAIGDDVAMVVQFLEVRKTLESWAAGQASQLVTDKEIEQLEALYHELEKDVEKNELGVENDVRFHLTIYQATHNMVLSHIAFTLLSLYHKTQRVTREVMFEGAINKQRLLQQHYTIFETIRDRNPERATQAILDHLNYAQDHFLRLISEK
jgi:GntR family transcriptional repressor for pyruvate dehydrogenase complex